MKPKTIKKQEAEKKSKKAPHIPEDTSVSKTNTHDPRTHRERDKVPHGDFAGKRWFPQS